MSGPRGGRPGAAAYDQRVTDGLLTAYRRMRDTPTSPRVMRGLAAAAIVANAGIAVTGGAVRLSESGLGCPTWPRCTNGSLLPTAGNPIGAVHQGIEFGNRLLTFLVFATAVACVVAAWRLPPRRRDVRAIALLLPLGVIAQAVLGGITVLEKLNPLTVAPHFLLSMVLTYVAVWLHARTTEGDDPPALLVRREIQLGIRLLVGVLMATLVAGTLVTATGPHAGDIHTRRLGWDPTMITQFHADLVFLYVGLVIALILGLRATRAPRRTQRRAIVLLGVVVLQAVVGYVQYFTHVPAVLVGVHIAGATLATVAAARLFFSTRERGPAPGAAALLGAEDRQTLIGL